MMKQLALTISALCIWHFTAQAQYPPQAGVPGSTAISRLDNSFVSWANGCRVDRGWWDIADKSQGRVSLGSDANATGIADNTGVVSLGDSGIAVLTFEAPIYNGNGFDFAVFENGFINPANKEESFIELAFVEVSSDGINYTRFAPSSTTSISPQVPASGVYMKASNINNMAGKYAAGYGTPFDLEELKGIPGLDINNITHVRVVDVIGDVGAHATKDKDGNIINDPYPTAFNGGGFDLDAVGVIHMVGRFPTTIQSFDKPVANFYPNPVTDVLSFELSQSFGDKVTITVTDITGKALQQSFTEGFKGEINMSAYNAGVYYISLQNALGNKWVERITKF
jgi:hypothetical protein